MACKGEMAAEAVARCCNVAACRRFISCLFSATVARIIERIRILYALRFLRRSEQKALTLPPKGLPEESPLLHLEGGAEALKRLYRLDEKIGEGAFGKVYACVPRHEAKEANSTMHICIKVTPSQGRKAHRVGRLPESEKLELLSLLKALEHPNIVRYHHFIETEDVLYAIMDRCEGPELVDHIEAAGGLLPLDLRNGAGISVRSITQQIISALAAVHVLGLMHRDVKPENFRFRDGSASTLQLLDFGAAKVCAGEPRAHTITGTLLYAAPEVFSGVYDHSCDMWSAGVVLFFLVSGQKPFDTSDVTMLRSMHRDPVLTGDSLLRGDRWREAPRALRELARSLLAVDPSARLSAKEALDHRWFRDDLIEEDMEESVGDGRTVDFDNKEKLTLLRRSCGGKGSWNELRRTHFVWNLADCSTQCDSNDELFHGDVPLSQDR